MPEQAKPLLGSGNTAPVPSVSALSLNFFGVKYVGEEHAQHLLETVRQYYKCSCDWKGERYCGLTLWCGSADRKVHLLMSRYVEKALTWLKHSAPEKPQHQPYPHVKPTYGAKAQFAKEEDTSPPLDKAGKKFIQEVSGVILFLVHAINDGLLAFLSALALQQANPPKNTMRFTKQILDLLTYRASNMVLAIHSNALYLSKAKAQNRAGGHMIMAGKDKIPHSNGAVINISQIILAVMSSAAEVELGALFINAKTAFSMQQTLQELGHPQPLTPMQTDITAEQAPLTNKIMPKALKAMDMCYTGYAVARPKANFVTTGDQAHRI